MAKNLKLPTPKVTRRDDRLYVHIVLEADPSDAMNSSFFRFLENNRLKLEQYGEVIYQGLVTPTAMSELSGNPRPPIILFRNGRIVGDPEE